MDVLFVIELRLLKLKSMLCKEEQEINIFVIFVTFDVLKELKSMLCKEEQ